MSGEALLKITPTSLQACSNSGASVSSPTHTGLGIESAKILNQTDFVYYQPNILFNTSQIWSNISQAFFKKPGRGRRDLFQFLNMAVMKQQRSYHPNCNGAY